MNATFLDREGAEREFDVWYPLPFVIQCGGWPVSIIPIDETNKFCLLRRKLADGTIDCWPCFGRPASEPVAWMLTNIGMYDI